MFAFEIIFKSCVWGEGAGCLDSKTWRRFITSKYLHCEIWDAYHHDNTTYGLEEKIEEKDEKAEWTVWSGKTN